MKRLKQNSLKNFDVSTFIWSSLKYSKKQSIISFISLAFGVLVVFSVGLNRKGVDNSSQIKTATGGFSLWCETSVPIYHDIKTEEGRAKLGLKDLPKETVSKSISTTKNTTKCTKDTNLKFLQLLKYSADDASCLNLNKVVTPNVLGIDMEDLKNSDFMISKMLLDNFEKFKKTENSVYPALVDETVLQWSLGKKLGDTLVYQGEKGKTVNIVLAGTIKNSIFQGYILIDKSLFKEIWSEISGSEVLLVKVPDENIATTKTILSQALYNYGIRITTTNERMKMFNSVNDTYLTIFFTLGGLGLLLGIFSFIIVLRKNIVARKNEFMLLSSLGFDKKRMIYLLYKELIIVPVCALLFGILGSFLWVFICLKI